MNNKNRKLLHNRNINFKGYIKDDNNYEIEAELIDTKNYEFKNYDRGLIKKNEPIHHMKIALVLDENMFVISAKATTISGPYSICKDANKNFKKIIGCTHITELLSSLATAAFQTIYPYKSHKKNNKNLLNKSVPINKPLLLGTCHSFDPKSDVVKRLWPEWYKNQD